MFSKSFSTVSIFVLVLLLPCQVFAHAIISPAIGVSGTAARTDVTRPSNKFPCGHGVHGAEALAGSTAVQANANVFTVTVTNFNGGKDGSTQIVDTSIDPSGTGSSFTSNSVAITRNGVASPSTTGSVQVSGILPAGTNCTGGNDGASCLVSFTTGGGFGNCILVSQGGSTTAFAAGTSGTTRSENGRDCNINTNAAGTRLARSLKLRKSLGESLEQNRSWIWAI
ncbi:hypothetical protein ACEPAG_8711 [Sanghuangporus baumii]